MYDVTREKIRKLNNIGKDWNENTTDKDLIEEIYGLAKYNPESMTSVNPEDQKQQKEV